MFESPCYDRKTKTDCPDRCPGCSATCEEWKKYEKKRNKEYEQRHRQKEDLGLHIDHVMRQNYKNKKHR